MLIVIVQTEPTIGDVHVIIDCHVQDASLAGCINPLVQRFGYVHLNPADVIGRDIFQTDFVQFAVRFEMDEMKNNLVLFSTRKRMMSLLLRWGKFVNANRWID